MIHTDAEADLAELLALLGDDEEPERDTPPKPATEPAPVTGMLPGPPLLRDGLVDEIVADLREHGVVAGNRAVEVIRAVSAMLSDTPHARRAGECIIAAIAGKTGLKVTVENGIGLVPVADTEGGA